MFFLLFLDLKLNTKHGIVRGEFHLFFNNMYKHKFIKKKIVNLQMKKNESEGWKVLKEIFDVLNF